MLEEVKTKFGMQFIAMSKQIARLILKNNHVPNDLEMIKKAAGYLEKAEWCLKTIKDDENVKTN